MPQTARSHHKILINPAELADWMMGPNPPFILDSQWSIAQPDGYRSYVAGHIPGARFIDMEHELSGAVGDGRCGRHPLPEASDLQETLQRLGLRKNQLVVIYDDATSLAAARAWWLLTYGGLGQVYLLDGGLAAWRRAGFEVAVGDAKPQEVPKLVGATHPEEATHPEQATQCGDVEISYGHLPVLEANDVASFAREGLLLDARAHERYTGEVEPVDPVGGHIPGAVNSPTTAHVHSDGTFLAPSELKEHYAQLGLADLLRGADLLHSAGSPNVAVYCGSGVTAAHHIVALAQIGVKAALYPGSWSGWINEPDAEIATGPLRTT